MCKTPFKGTSFYQSHPCSNFFNGFSRKLVKKMDIGLHIPPRREQVGVSRTRNQEAPGWDDDQASNDSRKISFRWEAERRSSVSSTYSSVSRVSSFKNCSITLNSTAIEEINHCYPRKGSWITTDSEFVVLEL
ncbi:uncharacterized protein LOC111491086 isoform X2 [Cucurbita maxima]|uniref:Uncharacterized protein LOC111491086 isoform X2 n=1 Tax=Cucurbita maxima TaxID=3661 RepID=A0A6J1K8G1_CUCMA|nr:uncharacterized protein LOC111491086 isoform X2 [Cucurbita maxima]